jgi:hypothetical protein
MKRQYIGIDKGDHIVDIVVARQRLVLQGKSLGILERESDKNEGFEFYKLIEKDEKKRLLEFKKAIKQVFRITSEEYDNVFENFVGNLEDFYYFMESKYK